MTEAHTGPASLHDTPAHGAGPRSAGQMLRALRESAGVDGYLEQLDGRSPFRRPDA